MTISDLFIYNNIPLNIYRFELELVPEMCRMIKNLNLLYIAYGTSLGTWRTILMEGETIILITMDQKWVTGLCKAFCTYVLKKTSPSHTHMPVL